MATDESEDTTIYRVVVNHEEQYSIWPADREAPLAGETGARQVRRPSAWLYVKEVWTDMRPLSLRKKMEEEARER